METTDSHPHHDRIVRLLEWRLETLAGFCERGSAGARLERRVIAVEAATRNAVQLEVLSPEEAGEIWAAVAARHPHVHWCRSGPGLAA